jgi:hypothetical protein
VITAGVRLEDLNNVTKHMCDECRDLAEDLIVVQVDVPHKDLLQLRQNVCEESGFLLSQLTGLCHDPALVSARRIFAKRAQLMGFSYSQIGKALCRHRSSVIHLVRT